MVTQSNYSKITCDGGFKPGEIVSIIGGTGGKSYFATILEESANGTLTCRQIKIPLIHFLCVRIVNFISRYWP